MDKKKDKQIEELIEALIWCSGSQVFAEGGLARSGWEKICKPLLDKHMNKKHTKEEKFKGEIEDYFINNYDVYEFLEFFYTFANEFCFIKDKDVIKMYNVLLKLIIEISENNDIDVIDFAKRNFW